MPTVSKYSVTASAFSRLHVDYAIHGGARISWDMSEGFDDPLPYSFQLQSGHTGNPSYGTDGNTARADDWTNVGNPVVNTFYAIDPNQQLFGKTAELHYRVILTTGNNNVYYSAPANVLGDLGFHDWLVVKEIVRKEALRNRVQVGTPGYLLKAVRYGPVCQCVDPVTQVVQDSHCLLCYGVGYQGGYWPAVPAVYGVIDGESSREAINPDKGMEKPVAVKARMLAEPQVYSMDVFVEQQSDKRHYIHPVSVIAQHRGYPVVIAVELRQAPFTDVIYKFPILGT